MTEAIIKRQKQSFIEWLDKIAMGINTINKEKNKTRSKTSWKAHRHETADNRKTFVATNKIKAVKEWVVRGGRPKDIDWDFTTDMATAGKSPFYAVDREKLSDMIANATNGEYRLEAKTWTWKKLIPIRRKLEKSYQKGIDKAINNMGSIVH